VQHGPTSDRQIIRLVERWAAVRKRHPGSRCFAVLVAAEVAPRYLNILGVIAKAVPVAVFEMQLAGAGEDAAVRFTRVRLR